MPRRASGTGIERGFTDDMDGRLLMCGGSVTEDGKVDGSLLGGAVCEGEGREADVKTFDAMTGEAVSNRCGLGRMR